VRAENAAASANSAARSDSNGHASSGAARGDTGNGYAAGGQGGTSASAASAPGAGIEVTPGTWNAMLTQLDVNGLARQLANNCVLIGRKGGLVRLGLDPRNNMMRVPNAVDKLNQALSKYFGETVRVEFDAPIPALQITLR